MEISIQAPPAGRQWAIITATDDDGNNGYKLQLKNGSTVVDQEFFLEDDEIIDTAGVILDRYNNTAFNDAVVGSTITFSYIEDEDDEY